MKTKLFILVGFAVMFFQTACKQSNDVRCVNIDGRDMPFFFLPDSLLTAEEIEIMVKSDSLIFIEGRIEDGKLIVPDWKVFKKCGIPYLLYKEIIDSENVRREMVEELNMSEQEQEKYFKMFEDNKAAFLKDRYAIRKIVDYNWDSVHNRKVQ